MDGQRVLDVALSWLPSLQIVRRSPRVERGATERQRLVVTSATEIGTGEQEALREWRTLSAGIREPFKKKLADQR